MTSFLKGDNALSISFGMMQLKARWNLLCPSSDRVGDRILSKSIALMTSLAIHLQLAWMKELEAKSGLANVYISLKCVILDVSGKLLMLKEG